MPTAHSPVVAEFSRTVGEQGVVAGLRFLNQRVEHRCSAVYRLQHLTVRSLYLYDREGQPLPNALAVVPLGDSFCQHAMREGAFLTGDTRADARVDGSPFKGVVIAYHGLPLLDNRGQLYGSLCHFDFVPRTLPDTEFHIQQEAARVLPRYLP